MTTTKKKTSEADNARFNELETIVTNPANKARLTTAQTAQEIRALATEFGVDTSYNSADMGKFIYKLKIIGVDYPALVKADAKVRRAELAQKATALADRADDLPVVRLFSAAIEDEASGTGAFAILDSSGTAVWYGGFSSRFERIRTPGDLISAEQSAADKAIFAASKARAAAGVGEIALWLTTTCPELNEAALKASGARLNVAVEIIVDDEDTTAVAMASTPGWRQISTVSDQELAALVEPVEVEDSPDEPEDLASAGGEL